MTMLLTMIGCVILFAVIVVGLIWIGQAWDNQPKAIENPDYDPDIVKILVQSGMAAEEIEITMQQRNALK